MTIDVVMSCIELNLIVFASYKLSSLLFGLRFCYKQPTWDYFLFNYLSDYSTVLVRSASISFNYNKLCTKFTFFLFKFIVQNCYRLFFEFLTPHNLCSFLLFQKYSHRLNANYTQIVLWLISAILFNKRNVGNKTIIKICVSSRSIVIHKMCVS